MKLDFILWTCIHFARQYADRQEAADAQPISCRRPCAASCKRFWCAPIVRAVFRIVAGSAGTMTQGGCGRNQHRRAAAVCDHPGGRRCRALEASLIGNVARLSADEVTRWERFTRLVGRRMTWTIATTFGLPELAIKRGRWRSAISFRASRALYRAEEIGDERIRHLDVAAIAGA
jgi:hypothetical protein